MKLLQSILVGCLADLSPFKDDILYEIKWAGEEANLDVPGVEYSQEDFVTGSNNFSMINYVYLPQKNLIIVGTFDVTEKEFIKICKIICVI